MRSKTFWFLAILAALFFIVGTAALGQESKPAMAGMVTVNAADLKWVPVEALPPGAVMAVIREDPVTKAVDFLAKVDKDYRVPKHWHSLNERVSIIEGAFTTETEGIKHTLTKGGFMYLPGKTVHEAWLKGKTMILVSTEGPFDVTYVNPADEPATYKAMKEKAAKGGTQ
ncbi:MAG: DUF4437 domain-containing protein [Thermoanaerobaculia bacterium]